MKGLNKNIWEKVLSSTAKKNSVFLDPKMEMIDTKEKTKEIYYEILTEIRNQETVNYAISFNTEDLFRLLKAKELYIREVFFDSIQPRSVFTCRVAVTIVLGDIFENILASGGTFPSYASRDYYHLDYFLKAYRKLETEKPELYHSDKFIDEIELFLEKTKN
ncbi:TPA: hypothetical protein IUW60_002839 [Enterococcus faecalis]|nr:hypothetical protein [Enterococcus faecalis]HAP4570968.1 hypothetical protein [Enterococcus faecalis]HAP4577756.1 hypothetical protein [Enterococcus faecalis]HAP4580688.1 hypothetical protein [Enterococcus faecalis]HAP4587167.1 hypothetical protein [Enterococcus faecalis]